MKKMLSLAAITLIGMPALADDTQGFYASVGGGVYRLDSNGFDDNAPSAMLTGGYSFGKFAAIEAAYSRMFNASDSMDGTRVKIDGNVWDLTTRLSYPVSNRVDPYVRMGWSYSDLAAHIGTAGMSVRLNDHDDGFSWAAGTGIRLNSRLNLNLEFARMHVTDDDLDRLSASVSYKFGAQ